MLTNLLALVVLLVSLIDSSSGIKIAINSPIHLVIGLVFIFLLYLTSLNPKLNILNMKTIKGSFYWNLKSSNYKFPVAVFLMVLSLGNFIYANSVLFTNGKLNGFDYILAIILSILAIDLLKNS